MNGSLERRLDHLEASLWLSVAIVLVAIGTVGGGDYPELMVLALATLLLGMLLFVRSGVLFAGVRDRLGWESYGGEE